MTPDIIILGVIILLLIASLYYYYLSGDGNKFKCEICERNRAEAAEKKSSIDYNSFKVFDIVTKEPSKIRHEIDLDADTNIKNLRSEYFIIKIKGVVYCITETDLTTYGSVQGRCIVNFGTRLHLKFRENSLTKLDEESTRNFMKLTKFISNSKLEVIKDLTVKTSDLNSDNIYIWLNVYHYASEVLQTSYIEDNSSVIEKILDAIHPKVRDESDYMLGLYRKMNPSRFGTSYNFSTEEISKEIDDGLLKLFMVDNGNKTYDLIVVLTSINFMNIMTVDVPLDSLDDTSSITNYLTSYPVSCYTVPSNIYSDGYLTGLERKLNYMQAKKLIDNLAVIEK